MIKEIRDNLEERPLRTQVEDITDRVPSGPLGAIGEGNVLGFIGFVLVESGEVITVPIPGVNRPGFKKVSHGAEVIEDGYQRHTIVVHSLSKDVAEFMTQYDSAPSNVDFVFGNTEVVSVEEMDTDAAYTTYEITVDVDRRPILN